MTFLFLGLKVSFFTQPKDYKKNFEFDVNFFSNLQHVYDFLFQVPQFSKLPYVREFLVGVGCQEPTFESTKQPQCPSGGPVITLSKTRPKAEFDGMDEWMGWNIKSVLQLSSYFVGIQNMHMKQRGMNRGPALYRFLPRCTAFSRAKVKNYHFCQK